MAVLIVGGAGYIGSHMVLHLVQQGVDVIVLDDLSTGSEEAVQGGTFYKGDLADKDLLRTIFANHDIDVVMHFAALIRVDESIVKPFEYYENNVSKTLVLLDEMVRANIKRFIFSSTAAVYGIPGYTPIDLKHSCKPINPYGQSKLMLEKILKDFDQAYQLKSIVFRYFNAAGADPQGRIGFHEPITHLIPQVLKVAMGQRDKLYIFGDDYNTPDGSCIRDYIHVNDLVAAHHLGMQQLMDDNKSSQYNLGTGHGYSVKEVVDQVQQVIGQDFTVEIAPRRAGDPDILIADATEAKQNLGWKAQYSSLENIIKDSWLWANTKV